MKQLFVDDHNLEAIENLARKLHQPWKFPRNVMIRPEYRWENCNIQIRTSPIWDADEGIFKMIYQGGAEGPDPEVKVTVTGHMAGGESFACYATSTDGVNWEKPFLELYHYEALTHRRTPIGKANNIIPGARGMLQGPIHDPHDSDPQRRYKGLRYGDGKLRVMASADLINWEQLDVETMASGDESHLTYDEDKRRFIATVKHSGPYGRSWYLSTSDDFVSWTEQKLIFHADQVDQENGEVRLQKFFDDPDYKTPIRSRPEERRTDVYNFPVFPYEGLYLAMPVMHHQAGAHPPGYENVDSRKSVELAASRDLENWTRVGDRAPFLEMSPIGDGSAYDTSQILVLNRPVVRNNELWFYYLGFRNRSQYIADVLDRRYLDASALCMARLRMDGFVSLKGGIEWGSVLSKPFVVDGKSLHINVDSWRGKVVGEILDADSGQPLPGYSRDDGIPAVIDDIDATLSWKEKGDDLSALAGKTVRLRFHIWQAELYAFWFAG